MTLDDYLNTNKIRLMDFAEASGLKMPFLSLVRHGKRIPSPRNAKIIEDASGGTVTRLELLYPLEDSRGKKKHA